MSLVLQSSGGGSVTIAEPTTASNFTQDLPAASGTVVITGTTPTLNGITFPATQVPSADANTLDDYEEGTWTPAINFAGGTTGITYSLRQGFYTKVGNMVYATCLINLSNKGSSTGAFRIGGLPFTTNSDSNYRATSMSMLWDGLSTNYVYMYGLVSTSVVAMDILGATAATNSNGSSVTNSNLSGSDNFRISILYQV
jgi:predicted secreted hydrolase